MVFKADCKTNLDIANQLLNILCDFIYLKLLECSVLKFYQNVVFPCKFY